MLDSARGDGAGDAVDAQRELPQGGRVATFGTRKRHCEIIQAHIKDTEAREGEQRRRNTPGEGIRADP